MTNEEIKTQLQDIKCHCQEMYEAEIKNGDASSSIWGKDVEALDLAIKKVEQTSWIPVSERLPLCEQEVLICTQSRTISGETKSIITSAIYEDGNMRERYSRWHWEDIEYESWDEEEDCGIIPEGWWEYRHYNPDEVYNNLVDNFILAWMPLPDAYKESEDKE